MNAVNAHKAIAQQYNLQLLAYEGGEHLGLPYTSGYTATLQTLFEKANRDARMGTFYQSLLGQWKQAGGGLFMHLGSTEPYNPTGQFGLLEYQGEPRTQAPKYDAVLKFINSNNCWWQGCAAAP